MSRFNIVTKAPRPLNHEGTPAHKRSPKLELFLLAAGSYAEQSSFYESTDDRSNRLRTLSQLVGSTDPEWIKSFVPYLRKELGMRTAAIVVAAEAAAGMVIQGVPGSREIISQAIWRADEPGEMLAYWHTKHGRKVPKPIKRGIADAAKRTYNEKNFLKFDSDKKAYGFKDVLRLVHPGNSGAWQAALYDYMTKGGDLRPELLTLQANAEVRRMAKIDASAITPEMVYKAGLTWEDMPSLTGRPWQAKDWETVIPSMKYLATLRNLNNFSKAGLGKEARDRVCMKLESMDDLRQSKTGPLNLLAAVKNQTSTWFTTSLGHALNNSVVNIPELKGKTLILVDTSSSMMSSFSKNGKIQYWEAAMLFGLALARRCDQSTVVSYSSTFREFPQYLGEDLQKGVTRFNASYNLRGGTNVDRALAGSFKGHDRVVILTDEQYTGYSSYNNYAGYGHYRADPMKIVPASVPLHVYNLAGYQYGGLPEQTPNRFYTAGLSDRGFAMIPLMEQIQKGTQWPWEV